MGSVIYRDRERDRFDDSRTTISTARRGDDRGGYTTVKRYVVKGEDDSRSSFGGGSRVRPAERVEETRIVRHEVDLEEPPRRYDRREDPRSSERELVIRRDRVEEEPRRDYGRRDERTEERELVIRRTTEREEPSRERELTVSRYDDRRDDRFDLDIRRGDYGDRDLQRYNRTTEYFQPAPPQTIVIRNEIIMPRGRDDDYDNIRRSEADEERSVVKREPSRGRDEEFFYEKKVKERIEEPARRDDDYDDRRSKREISPHDSVSQVGRRDRGYSSDDSMVYVRNKVTEDEGYDRSRSPKHKRHIAEGVIAGIGAAELLRHHKKEEGRETSGTLGRVGRDVGAGALGALAAEGVTRARSAYRERSKSRRRSRSDSGGRGGRSRSRGGSRGRDRSRSESTSRAKKLAGLGLGAAAIAAAAIYAQKRNNKEKSQSPSGRGRSSSRRRASSVPPSEADDARNPSHRNKRMAEAGAAGAVLAALVERQRSKSRGGRDRSRSKLRQALPVVVAGLGSAGLAALYEKNKAKKETEAAAANAERRESRSRSRSRSRGRGRSADPYYDGPRGVGMNDPNLIEYGEGNVYGNNYSADYYGQPPPGDAYYNNHQNAVVPAVAGAGAYAASREVRPSRSRSLSSQSSTDDGGRRRRRHRRKRGSRSRSAGKEAAAAVGGVAAASEYDRQKQERRDRRAQRRQEQQGGYTQDPYEDPYNPQQQQHQQQQYTPTPPPANDPYAAQTGFYPQSQQFPPPPGAAPPQFQTQMPAAGYAPGTSFNPNDFPPPPVAAPAQYNGNFASGGNADPYAPRGRGADENVSAAPTFGNPFQSQNHSVPDGLNTERSVPPFGQPPLINVQPPSVSDAAYPQKSNPFLPIPNPFGNPVPPPQPYYPASTARSTSQPPAHRKSVAFADAPVVAGNSSSTTIASSQQSGHHRHVDATRGYEAGDDSDSTINAQRTNRGSAKSQAQSATPANAASATSGFSLDPGSEKKRHHSRRRSADPTASSAARSAPVDASASTSQGPIPAASPAPSDETIDLPERFDKQGRKKPEPGDDPVADRLDNILAGKGATGKLFGNFVDGLFGPEGRKKKGK